MKALATIAVVFLFACAAQIHAAVAFTQPPNPAGGHHKSAWYPPDGLDGDEYAFDNFMLASSTAVNEVRWRGAYTNYLSGAGRAPVFDFTISIYGSLVGGSQPDLGPGGRLARYTVGGNAGETPVGTFGGVIMYDYAFVLPVPFAAAGGTTYWIQIEALQGLTPTYYWPPDWSLASGTGGNNVHFRRITGGPYQAISGDLAFTLLSSDAPTATITASVSPAGAGTITGAGPYPINSSVSLNATANAGWGFVNWTVSGAPVSTNPHYTFPATADRTLVANFVPAYTVTTSSNPPYAGVVAGGGVYNDGSTATVVAVPNHGFAFSSWSDGSTAATHSFTVTSDIWLTAIFVSAPLSVTFDFDNAPVHTSLPIHLIVDGLGAQFSGTDGNYSVQPAGTVGINPPGFSGLILFPNTVFPADLIAEFSEPLVDFSILYSPQELGCDNSATMRATVYMDGVFVATNTTTAPVPGTYPSATLSIAAPTGFNRVVVHYDARPPTCQDWGPIFLADNVTVTRVCTQPAITGQPASTAACTGAVATFGVAASGPGVSYQWQVESPLGSTTYFNLSDGPFAGVGTISGSNQDILAVSGFDPAPMNRFRCVVTNPCGSVTSDAATYTICRADFNCSGAVSVQDVFDFLAAYFAGDPAADFNAVGGLSVQDIFDFLAAYFAGCN